MEMSCPGQVKWHVALVNLAGHLPDNLMTYCILVLINLPT